MPRARNINQSPFHRRRNRGPILPLALLSRAVQVEQEKRNDIERAGLRHRVLAPRLERLGREVRLGGSGSWCVGVVGERGDGLDLAVEVVGEAVAEAVHDADKLGAVKRVGLRLRGPQVLCELGEPTEERLVLLVRALPDGGVLEHLLDLGEQRHFLVVVVRDDELVPGQAVSDEVGDVGGLDVRGLLVDGVETAENGVVEERHVGCAGGEEVGLE